MVRGNGTCPFYVAATTQTDALSGVSADWLEGALRRNGSAPRAK
jgi:hypothetical protein